MSDRQVSGRLDSKASHFVAIFGRKGTGKTMLAHRLFLGYPYDRVVVDVHGETSAPDSPIHVADAVDWSDVPLRWPAPDPEGGRQTFRWIPDPASPTYADHSAPTKGRLHCGGGVPVSHRDAQRPAETAISTTRATALPRSSGGTSTRHTYSPPF